MNKLYRSRRDKHITGLCGGLAKAFDIDTTLLRLVLVVTAVFSGGSVIMIYLLASIVIPAEPYEYDPFMQKGANVMHGPQDMYGFRDKWERKQMRKQAHRARREAHREARRAAKRGYAHTGMYTTDFSGYSSAAQHTNYAQPDQHTKQT